MKNIGIKTSLFASTPSAGPKMSWEDPMSYPAIKGLTRFEGVTISDFGPTGCNNGAHNYFWMTSPKYGDIFHPMEMKETTLVNVAEKSKVFYCFF